MQVHLGVPLTAQIIESYSDGVFRVAGTNYDQAIVVRPDKTALWSGTPDLGDDCFAEAIALLGDCEVVLLGTGRKSQFVLLIRVKFKINVKKVLPFAANHRQGLNFGQVHSMTPKH